MSILAFYAVAVVLITKLIYCDAEDKDYCITKHLGTLLQNKVHVPGVGLPLRMKKASARIPNGLCGDKRRQVGVSVVACDVVPKERPKVQIVSQSLVRVQRQGYAWLSHRGDLIIMVSCEDLPRQIEFPDPDWRWNPFECQFAAGEIMRKHISVYHKRSAYYYYVCNIEKFREKQP